MDIKSVAPGDTWNWFVGGWGIFMKSPGMWIALVLIYLVIHLLLGLIPVIGSIALALITPALIAGLMVAARMSDLGDGPQIAHLFQGLSDVDKRGPLLILGTFYLGGMFIAVLAGVGMLISGTQAGQMPAMGAASLLGILFVLAVILALVALFLYAAPLVLFQDMSPVDAVKGSYTGSLKNIPSLLVAGLIYLVLSVIATIPAGLGWLILGPVTAGAVYRSYQDIFT